MSELVLIQGKPVPAFEYAGQRVTTFKQIDELHQRPAGTAKRNFKQHRHHFKKGHHYWELTRDEIRTEFPTAPFGRNAPSGIVLSERGYFMLTKPFTDDLSWLIFEDMSEHYFVAIHQPTPMLTGQAAINHVADALQDPAFMTEALHQMIIKAQVLQEQLAAVAPDVAFARKVQGSAGSLTVGQAAKVCGDIGRNRLYQWLIEHGFLMRDKMPYQWGIEQGLFEVRINVSNGEGKTFSWVQVLITPKGLARIMREMGCGQSLALELDANPSVPALPGGVL